MADWITLAEAAQLAGYHPDHLRELAREGKIKARKFATVWQIERTSLLAYKQKIAQLGGKRGPKKGD